MRLLKSNVVQILIACLGIFLFVLMVYPKVHKKPVLRSQDHIAVPHHRTGLIGVSDAHVDNLRAIYHSNPAQNDPTGLKRITRTDQAFIPERFALSFYQKYFKVDNEIHYILNFSQKTVTEITKIGGLLHVKSHVLLEGIQHDATRLLSGPFLSYHVVYLDNGDIEKIKDLRPKEFLPSLYIS